MRQDSLTIHLDRKFAYLQMQPELCKSLDCCRSGSQLSSSQYQPDAALINYYKAGDTLGGHLDDVEKDMSKPIVSFSLGCDAIFLLGGQFLCTTTPNLRNAFWKDERLDAALPRLHCLVRL